MTMLKNTMVLFYKERNNLPILFSDAGCDLCRRYWTHPFLENKNEIMTLLVEANQARQARLYQCNICGAYWEEPNGAYPLVLSQQEVAEYYDITDA